MAHRTKKVDRRNRTIIGVLAALAVATLGVTGALTAGSLVVRSSKDAEHPPTRLEPHTPVRSDRQAPTPSQHGGSAGMSGVQVRAPVTMIPPIGTRAKTKPWIQSTYGDDEDQLGEWQLPRDAEGESRAPQGFVVTREGDLLVLDSEKDRLVWFGPDTQIKRMLTLEGLKMPADVAIAADGTIAVMDHEGVQTEGTLLLTPEGKRKGMLPQAAAAAAVDFYAVGNDFFAGLGGSSLKLGESSGVPSDETPGLYNQSGTIPGSVAPDGRTIVDADIASKAEGRFFISAIRDDPPEHIFTREYTVPVKKRLSGMPYVQSDARGTIYVVLDYDGLNTVLVCFDGPTGDPLGTVALPGNDRMTGTAFKQFAVDRERGGLVYHQLLEGGSSYARYDCR